MNLKVNDYEESFSPVEESFSPVSVYRKKKNKSGDKPIILAS